MSDSIPPRYPPGVITAVFLGLLFVVDHIKGLHDLEPNRTLEGSTLALPFVFEVLLWSLCMVSRSSVLQAAAHIAVLGASCTTLAAVAIAYAFVIPVLSLGCCALALTIGLSLTRLVADQISQQQGPAT